MEQAEATGPSTSHVAGSFYKAIDANGSEYIGPKEKAEAFSRGEFAPTYRNLPPPPTDTEEQSSAENGDI